jgi:hypothetical protein
VQGDLPLGFEAVLMNLNCVEGFYLQMQFAVAQCEFHGEHIRQQDLWSQDQSGHATTAHHESKIVVGSMLKLVVESEYSLVLRCLVEEHQLATSMEVHILAGQGFHRRHRLR